jgi:hypothetical protein
MCSDIGSAPPRLRRGQRQRDDVLRHRFGPSALIGGNRQFPRQVAGRHPIDAGGGELQQPGIADQRDLVGPQFLRRVVGQHRPGTPERVGAVGQRQIDEIDRLGGPAQFFRDDRPAAPRQPIGHHQRPCTHSPDSVLIHLQYRDLR